MGTFRVSMLLVSLTQNTQWHGTFRVSTLCSSLGHSYTSSSWICITSVGRVSQGGGDWPVVDDVDECFSFESTQRDTGCGHSQCMDMMRCAPSALRRSTMAYGSTCGNGGRSGSGHLPVPAPGRVDGPLHAVHV